MVRFEDLDKVYAGYDYSFLDRSGLSQADTNLQLNLFLSPNIGKTWIKDYLIIILFQNPKSAMNFIV